MDESGSKALIWKATSIAIGVAKLNYRYGLGLDAFIAEVDDNYTNANGIAEIKWIYPSSGVSGALAFYAEVVQVNVQKVITSPVLLNVGDATKLLVWIDRRESSTLHTIRGR